MATLETKFSIGDVVYYATTSHTQKQRPCPDCNGTRKWKAVAPSGREYEFSCPRCSTGYMSDHRLSLSYSAYAPAVSKLTVGQVRATIPATDYNKSAEYMCVETGVGSGSLYAEDRLFATEAEAMAAATALADEQSRTIEHCVEQFNASLEVSDYQLDDAREHVEKKALSALQWKMRDLVEDMQSADTIEDVKERLEAWGERNAA